MPIFLIVTFYYIKVRINFDVTLYITYILKDKRYILSYI